MENFHKINWSILSIIYFWGMTMLLCLFGASTFGQGKPKPLIILQPMRPVRAPFIIAAQEGIIALFDTEVKVAAPIPLFALDPHRLDFRYRAEEVLAYLRTNVKGNCRKVVGLTSEDISMTIGEHPDRRVLETVNNLFLVML